MLAFTLYSHLSPGMRRSFQPTLRCRRRYHTVALTENARRGGGVAGFVENLTSLYGSAAAAIKTRRGVDRSAMKRINLHRCRSLYRAAALRGRATMPTYCCHFRRRSASRVSQVTVIASRRQRSGVSAGPMVANDHAIDCCFVNVEKC